MKTGIVLAILRLLGCMPEERDKFINFAKGLQIKYLVFCKIVEGMLKGPDALLLLSLLIMSVTSDSSAGVKANVLETGFFKKDLNDLLPSYFLSLRIESAIVEKYELKFSATDFGSLVGLPFLTRHFGVEQLKANIANKISSKQN